MYLCIYVFVYLCICVFMYLCIYVFVYLCICVFMYLCIYCCVDIKYVFMFCIALELNLRFPDLVVIINPFKTFGVS